MDADSQKSNTLGAVTHPIGMLQKIYELAVPFGRRRLLTVFLLSLVQGIVQVIGVTSIFPFLALAANTAEFRASRLGRLALNYLPAMDDGQLLVFAGVFSISMLLIANAVNVYTEWNRTYYAHQFGDWLRVRLLRQLLLQPYSYFMQHHSAVFHKKITADVMQYTRGVLLPLLDSSARLVTVLLLSATLVIVDVRIALGAVVVVGGFYSIVYLTLTRLRKRVSDGVKQANRDLGVEVLQLIGGIKPIKVHRAEEHFIGVFADHSRELAKLMPLVPLLASIPRYLIEPLVFGGMVAFMLALALRGEDLTTILPSMGVIALASYRLLPASQLLYAQVTQLNSTRHALEEVYDEFHAVTKLESEQMDTAFRSGKFQIVKPVQWKRQIELQDLTFSYPGTDEAVIDHLNLSIPHNTSLAITGETGSGKSTLIDLILGLHLPTSGRILVDDNPLNQANLPAWRASIGYVPQEIFLIDDTIASNIAFGLRPDQIDMALVREACQMAQIDSFIQNQLPNGYQTIVGERGTRLSGGQKQRIGLARALYRQPTLLVLDEATSALDQRTEADLVRSMNRLQGKTTMLVIAHRLSTIERCDARFEMPSRKSKVADTIE